MTSQQVLQRNTMRLNEYMLIKEAAAYLGVTGNTLRNWEQAGKIKTIRHPLNKYRLYKKEDLEKLLYDIEATRSVVKESK